MSDGKKPPSIWSRPSDSRKVGRIGDWNNNGSSNSPQPQSGATGRFATLSALSSSSGSPRPAASADDKDDEGDARNGEGESWFAGGERSGISVQNPGSRDPRPRIVQDILRRAAETSASRPSQSARGELPSAAFRGGGHTLGSDEVESTYVPDVGASEEEEEVIQRNITFWRNGFSVEGGEFYSYADPANEQLLAEINTGRAPVSVLNVGPDQPVEVVVSKRVEEDYVPERRPLAAFSGSGNRLGSPVPSFAPRDSATTAMPGSFPSGSTSSAAAARPPAYERERINTQFEVDQTQPTTTVQIRLADGTRLPCRMNHTHTVRDIRNFINAARPENLTRPYTIGTTFPNRVLDNDSQTIKDAGLVNSVIVQRWV
ncbi:hypothetical protein ID866_1900 [Astraeus odoratus]|nr:hypothetical protein ID866_1900 [Astraeus odoratus]